MYMLYVYRSRAGLTPEWYMPLTVEVTANDDEVLAPKKDLAANEKEPK